MKPTPAEIRNQAPHVGAAGDSPSSVEERVDELEATAVALAPLTTLIVTPATNIAAVTGGASATDEDVEARAAIDGILAVLVDAGLMEAEE